ncbi:MAG: M23 family peptidase [Pseudolabrys sp.]
MRFPVVVSAVLCLATAAAADEIQAPRVTLSQVDWEAAAATIADRGTDTPAAAFARLNKQTEKRFSGVGKSSVPVLLPVDIDAFRKDDANGSADAATSEKYFGAFQPTKFFLPGPAGYDATFYVKPGAGLSFHYTKKPIEVEITGAAFVYDLDGPNHQEEFTPKGLEDLFPGIRRILREAHVRYVFERFGVPYVLSIQCYDQRVSAKYLSCREADPIAERFLRALHTAGGTPAPIKQPHFDVSRPQAKSDFTYYGPGDLIPDTGWKKLPGRADYHVYAHIRFPIANAPAYVKSQSFMPWGDCYRSGRVGRLGKKNSEYRCKVNGLPLVFNEAAAVNFTYPWRDNFCELRDFLVGQCPGGWGHQGEDIRPANCVLFNDAADRCEPYQHTIAAVHDGTIWRMAGNLGLYIVVNTPNDLVRFRYLHMNPKMLDADEWFSGRQVSEGEILGKVATWGDFEKGTSYHVHFNIQVFTKSGWVWVNPYMTLVTAYERLIGGRGTEIKPGDPAPVIPDKPPVVLHPTPPPGEASTNSASSEKPTTASASDERPIVAPEKPKRPHHKRAKRRRHREED